MPIVISCSSCKAKLNAPESAVGKTVRCPKCQTAIKVSAGADPAPARKTAPPADDYDMDFEEAPKKTAPKKPADDYDDDYDDEPPRKGGAIRKARDDYDDEPPRKGRGRRDEEDDYDDDRPARGRKGGRRSGGIPSDVSSKKVTAGLLAILLGGWGVHKFYLGMPTAGIIQLVLVLPTCGISGIIAFIEGIIYLTKSDEDFYRTYIVEKKSWF